MCFAFIYHPNPFLPSFFQISSSFILISFVISASNLMLLFVSFCVFLRSCSPFPSSFLALYLLYPVYLFFPRLSPVWEVSEWALRAVASSRLCSLAQPRAPAAGWQPDRPLLAPVSNTQFPEKPLCVCVCVVDHAVAGSFPNVAMNMSTLQRKVGEARESSISNI